MTSEEEWTHLREQVAQRDEQLAQRDARIQHLEAALEQQGILMHQMHAQSGSLTQQVQELQERQAKDSHNSSLPPSSDRFLRKTRSLRKKSEKKTGGQKGHPGTSLAWSSCPDEIIEQSVEQCEACHHDLHEVPANALSLPLHLMIIEDAIERICAFCASVGSVSGAACWHCACACEPHRPTVARSPAAFGALRALRATSELATTVLA